MNQNQQKLNNNKSQFITTQNIKFCFFFYCCIMRLFNQWQNYDTFNLLDSHYLNQFSVYFRVGSYMVKHTFTVLCLAVIIVVVLSEIEMATICEKDQSCSSGYRFRLCGNNGFSYDACSDACTRDMVQSFYIKQCDVDFENKGCTSGVCYYNRTIHYCYAEDACVAAGYVNYTKCQACVNCETEVCFTQSASPTQPAPAQCSQKEKCPYKQSSFRLDQCPVDYSSTKQNCTCCITQHFEYDLESNENTGYCIDSEDSLNIQQLISNVKSYTNETIKQISEQCVSFNAFIFEPIHYTSFVLLVIALLLVPLS